jgi:hypothetical protein
MENMTARHTHYELAFETYLDRRGIAYVAVENVRHFFRGRVGIKAFDYIVYPAGSPPCLVDLKGRKAVQAAKKHDCRQKNWVTRSDITGLLTWQEVFGREYSAAFVFAYWVPTGDDRLWPDAGAQGSLFTFAGRRYSFWIVPAAEYARHQRHLSTSWDTVAVRREVFRQISQPLSALWPPAPC